MSILITDNSTLRGFNLAIRVSSIVAVFFLPLYQFIVFYTVLGWISNLIAQRTEFNIKMAMQQWPWLFYVQFISVPITSYMLWNLVDFLF